MSSIKFDIPRALHHLDGQGSGPIADIVQTTEDPSAALANLPAVDIYQFGPTTVARFDQLLGSPAGGVTIGDVLAVDPAVAQGVLSALGTPAADRAQLHLDGLRASVISGLDTSPAPAFSMERFKSLNLAREGDGRNLFANSWLRSEDATKVETADIRVIDGINATTEVAFGAGLKLLDFARLTDAAFDEGIGKYKLLPNFATVSSARMEALVDQLSEARALLRASMENTPEHREALIFQGAVTPNGPGANAQAIQPEDLGGAARAAVERAITRIADRSFNRFPGTDYEAKYDAVYRVVDPDNGGQLLGYAVRGIGATSDEAGFADSMVYTMKPDGRPVLQSYDQLA
ncbi:MAG: hypothetical protein AAFX94_07270 [Myxococcota bacterium]